jgi:hypothetical protein
MPTPREDRVERIGELPGPVADQEAEVCGRGPKVLGLAGRNGAGTSVLEEDRGWFVKNGGSNRISEV